MVSTKVKQRVQAAGSAAGWEWERSRASGESRQRQGHPPSFAAAGDIGAERDVAKRAVARHKPHEMPIKSSSTHTASSLVSSYWCAKSHTGRDVKSGKTSSLDRKQD